MFAGIALCGRPGVLTLPEPAS
ncbi:hypothetical protein CBM2623_B30224 [Cupriavidus taiwanensis]|nr:hypothetical protein CBM2588_B40020 [Cupriavidus taiwanensis]SOY95629.1 hypothetical protein CBM2591_B20200 [Cupriavidus taiwanensis]SOZ29877.1 hypothetical protein CBM2608_B30228 [Cupriavidus taiwanensis]SOZ74728.1 hypothetical protein CBM2617_B60117 [Cupriavidus taiwanensis]SOZ88375.1 hypothetical protein CBM2618_B50119 [Cupriavidus taiwanensis]